MKRNSKHSRVKNYMFPTDKKGVNRSTTLGVGKPEKDLRASIVPVQFKRIRTDVMSWRDAVDEVEKAYYPFRVKMQRIMIDTILNAHVNACVERRKDLTLLREFEFINSEAEVNEDITKFFSKQKWFSEFISYALDAIFYGYSLINLGDVVNNTISEVNIIPRWFVSPDRFEVGSFVYSPSGTSFLDDPYRQWHIYVSTPSDNGQSPCGYGLLYNVALYEIFLRNLLGYNGDFVELYAMPYRVGKTSKRDEQERAEFEQALRDMGSNAYAIIDPMDEISFLDSSSSGTGYLAYDNLEERCQKMISKIILGHSDGLDSTVGKLGSQQGGEDSPQMKALFDKQTKDGKFIEYVINNELIPRMIELGIFPDDISFQFKNDRERIAVRAEEDKNNTATAELAQTMKNAGLKMPADYFAERTGIKAEEIQEPAPGDMPGQKPNAEDIAQAKKIENKLNELYG